MQYYILKRNDPQQCPPAPISFQFLVGESKEEKSFSQIGESLFQHATGK